jgi:hypothetical protein
MRVNLQYFAPGQQQRLTDGVIQVLHGAGRFPEDWIVLKGTPRNFVIDFHSRRWFGRIGIVTFDKELPHVLRRFKEWLVAPLSGGR